MKLLLFSDLHFDIESAESLAERASEVDVVIGAGDFGSFRRSLQSIIQVLQDIEVPTIVVPGNNESREELEDACQGWTHSEVLHGNGIQIGGIDFFGIGGGIPVTPFGEWSYDFTEEQAARLLEDCPLHAVLVSHSPPKGIVDRSSRGLSLGSTAVLDTIHAKRPPLVVCGHIHESAGEIARIEDTVIVNAGPKGIVWDLEGRCVV